MSFVRPAASAALLRWREALVGLGVICVGAWWALTPGQLLPWVGYALIFGGIAMVLAGVQRARFRTGASGPGVVNVDEGQITYFGPLTGGAVALSELATLSLDTTGKPAHWVLFQPGQPELYIPLTATGTEALFDVFATLPGIRTERMLALMRRSEAGRHLVWQRPDHVAYRAALT